MTKPKHFAFSAVILVAILLFALAACAPATAPAPTQTPNPTATFTPYLPMITLFTLAPPTVIPTRTPFVPAITPDAIQVVRWKEYQTELAKGILPTYSFEKILCEWDILARSGQEVYVWAVCASPNVDDTRPAVVHLGADDSVRSVEILERGSSPDIINRLFPEAAQVKFDLYAGDSMFRGRLKEMRDHLESRQAHPEEPPLIVLSAMPMPTPTP